MSIDDSMPYEKNTESVDCDTPIDAETSMAQINKESEGSSGMLQTAALSFSYPEIKEAALEKTMKNSLAFDCVQQSKFRDGVEKPTEVQPSNCSSTSATVQQNAHEDPLAVLDGVDDDELLVEIVNGNARSRKIIEKTTGRQKMSCPHCAKKFFSNSRLQSHLVNNHKLNNEEHSCLERVFKCNIDGCNKTFKTAVWLKIHKAAHAGENQESMSLTMHDF
jgi:hypothetical protein